jgi:putative DNA primase/helicase
LRLSGRAGCGKRRAIAGLHATCCVLLPPDRSGCDGVKRTEAALAIWEAAMPAGGTPVETYLAARGIHLQLPTTLRFHARLKHPCGGIWPAMVALVTRGADDTRIAIHRTYLARGGGGKAPVDPQKMMLGPCRGGAVRLGLPGDVLMVGEGIETCLAAMPNPSVKRL